MAYGSYGYQRYRRAMYKKRRRRMIDRALAPARRAFVKQIMGSGHDGKLVRGSSESLALWGASRASADEQQRALRRAFRYRGSGAYSMGKFIRDVGALGEGVKKTYNAWVPKIVRDQVVDMGLGALKRYSGGGLYTGRGAYAANSLVVGGEPSMSVGGPQDESESIVISNREYVQDVYGPGSAAFTNQSIQLNPGLQQNFPWLAQIAINYEEYDFLQLIFTYRSIIDIGNANTTGQSGSLVMVCDYNASHAPFDTKEAMMCYHGAVSGKATEDLVCGIECDPAKTNINEGFVRTGPVPYGEDIKTYDHGLFQFAISNIPAAMQNQQLGELWVDYTVRLRKPKLATSRGFAIQQDTFVAGESAWNGTLATPAANSDGPRIAAPLGALTKLLAGRANNIGCLVTYPALSQMQLTFPASLNGLFRITYTCTMYAVSTGFSGAPVPTYGGNVTALFDQYAAVGLSNAALPGNRSICANNYGMNGDWDVSIKSVTGAVNNTFLLDFSGMTQTLGAAGAGYMRMAQVTVTELNPTFGTATNSAAQLVNPAGTITAPLYF